MEKLLTKFLEVNLLPHLTNNEQFTHTESAIKEVNKILAKNRKNLINYTLTALHSDLSKDNPVIEEVDKALNKHWKTVRNIISDEPRQIWRAIIWEALNQQAKDVTSAAVIWLTAGSLFQHCELDANEKIIIGEFLLSLRNKVEKEAGSLWYQSNQKTPQNFELDFELTKPKDNNSIDNNFKSDLVKAAGPNDINGTALEGANPNWANTNQTWSDAFADRASKAIQARINSSANNLKDGVYSQFEEFVNEITEKISQFSQNLVDGQTYRNIRNELLWWRQTLYSLTLKKSYREIDPITAAFTIAYDLHSLIDDIYPASVEYLMRETFTASQIETTDKNFLVKDILEKLISNSDSKIVVDAMGNYYKTYSNPMPLAGIIKKSIDSDQMNKEDLDLLGLKSKAEITLPEFSVWMFRDLQAYRLASKKQK